MTADPAPGLLRRLTPPRALVVMAVLLVVIFVASRTCANSGDVTQQQAVETARGQVDFRPDGVNVRFLRRGVGQQPYWAVSLWQRAADGSRFRRVTVVVVSADTGEVTEVRRDR
jgi:hypothetical protein